MAGSATSLILLHFYTGGVVYRCHGWETGTLEVFVFCPLLLPFGLPSHFFIVSVMSCWRRDAAVGRLMVVGLEDTGADGGTGVLLWRCWRGGTERRLTSFFCGKGGWKNGGTMEATAGLWFWESWKTGGLWEALKTNSSDGQRLGKRKQKGQELGGGRLLGSILWVWRGKSDEVQGGDARANGAEKWRWGKTVMEGGASFFKWV
jgi:hypothetical protein